MPAVLTAALTAAPLAAPSAVPDAVPAAVPDAVPAPGQAAVPDAGPVLLHPTRPAFRVVPAPPSAPPYDDERTGAPVLRLVPTRPGPPPSAVPFDDAAWLASERTPTALLPSADDFARTLVQAVLEVLAGVRPVSQLRRDTTPELYLRLRTTMRCRPWTSGPRPDRRAVRSVHVQQRPEGVAEACATVRRGTRLAALALRFEGVDGRWQCTDLVGL